MSLEEINALANKWNGATRELGVLDFGGTKFDGLTYHYTSSAGLLGMLRSGLMWGTHIGGLNDSEEYIHGKKLIRDELTTAASSLNREIRELLDRAIDDDSQGPTYVMSFSLAGDLLSQWRTYAPRNGFCLGFKDDQLSAFSRRIGPFSARQICSYRVETKRAQITHVLDDLVPKLAEDNLQDEERDKLISAWATWSLCAAASFKNPSFIEEKEVRILYWSIPLVNRETNEIIRPSARQNFRTQATGKIIPYVELPLADGPGGKLEIERIIVGPNTDFEWAKEVIEMMMNDRNLVVGEVVKSESSFRD